MADLTLSRAGAVARITLSRPPLNILTAPLIDELGAAVREVGGDPAIRVVVLAGAGRAFSAGVDMQAMRDLDPPRARAFIGALHATIEDLRALDVPTIARLHGHVLGGALELAAGCDLRLSAEGCRLGMPEITVGIPSVIEAALLPGLIGWGRAAELLLTGDPIEATEAQRWGLINRAVPEAALDGEVERWVGRLLALPPHALRLQKALLRQWRGVDLGSAIAFSTAAFAAAYATDEPRKAMQEFLGRRRSP